MRKPVKFDSTMWLMLLLMAFGYLLLHSLLGGTLLLHADWDSYTLQADAWLRGRVGLGQDYPWLELAVYQGDWYVSFPPLPSVFMLPFVLVFGTETPSNVIVAVYALASAAVAYKTLTKSGVRDVYAAFWSLFTVWGCNLLWMSTNGGVWFQAQALNMLLCLACVGCAMSNRRGAAFALLALAVGCRPFSVLYFPVLLLLFYGKDKQSPGFKPAAWALSQLKYLIAPALIGAAYLWYNYIRFDDLLEFGHNHLPEFIESPDGQFNISYLLTNLYNLFLRPIALQASGALQYPVFNGFMFYIANPIFIVWFIAVAGDIIKKRMSAAKVSICSAALANILALCLHKTLGGWQFGARYTVDLVPFVLMYLVLAGKSRPGKVDAALGAFAIMLNLYGALAMTFLHG